MRFKTLIFTLITLGLLNFLNAQEASKLTASAFEQKIKSDKEVQLVDVRTKKEYQEGHIKDAVNIDYNSDEFNKLVAHLDKDKPTYVYCLAGGRSSAASKVLKEKGFKEVYDLEGGMRKWKEEGKPFEASTNKDAGMSKEDFDKLIKNEKLALVDFGAKWCAPCKRMAPSIDKLSKDEALKAKVVKIDVDENEPLSQLLKIDVLPTLHLYKGNKLVWQHEGYLNEQELIETIVKYSK